MCNGCSLRIPCQLKEAAHFGDVSDFGAKDIQTPRHSSQPSYVNKQKGLKHLRSFSCQSRMAIFGGPSRMDRKRRDIWVSSRGTFPILSRDPSFQRTIRTRGETAVFLKRTMVQDPLDPICLGYHVDPRLKKGLVFTMKHRSRFSQNYQLKKVGIWRLQGENRISVKWSSSIQYMSRRSVDSLSPTQWIPASHMLPAIVLLVLKGSVGYPRNLQIPPFSSWYCWEN